MQYFCSYLIDTIQYSLPVCTLNDFFFRTLGNLQQALVCLEKRLVVSHELGVAEAKAQAYGELGSLHISLSNLDQAISCLEHQKNIAK